MTANSVSTRMACGASPSRDPAGAYGRSRNRSSWSSTERCGAIFRKSEELALLGINTRPTPPTSLRCAAMRFLLTALATGDGGTGDMQAKLNKETAGDTAALLFQSGFSGRAELGLAGDDDIHLKVSPDGSSWTEALVVDRTTGRATFHAFAAAPAARRLHRERYLRRAGLGAAIAHHLHWRRCRWRRGGVGLQRIGAHGRPGRRLGRSLRGSFRCRRTRRDACNNHRRGRHRRERGDRQ